MIKWAEGLKDKTLTVSYYLMFKEIGESWNSEHCDLCQNYRCFYCPLAKIYGPCSIEGVKNNWGKLDKAMSWKEWIKEAKKMRRQLKVVRIFILIGKTNE